MNVSKMKKGFTLLELVVVIVVLGILAAIAIPSYQAVIDKSNLQSAKTSAQSLLREVAAVGAFDGTAAVTPADLDAAWADVPVSVNNVHVGGTSTATFSVGGQMATYTITTGVGAVTP